MAIDCLTIRLVEHISMTCYLAKTSNSTEVKKRGRVVDFGNEQRYCYCTCQIFRTIE